MRELAKQQEDLQLKEERIQSELAGIQTQLEMVGKEVKNHRSNLTIAEKKLEESEKEKARVAMEIEALYSEKEKSRRQLEFEQKLMITRWGLEAAIQAYDSKNKEIEKLKSQVAERDQTIVKEREVILMLKKIERQDEAEKKLASLEENITDLVIEREELRVKNEELQKTSALKEKQVMTVLETEVEVEV